MPTYYYPGVTGRGDEVTVIEERDMVFRDRGGHESPGFRCIDTYTAQAHPVIIQMLLKRAKPLQTMEDVLAEVK